MDLYSEFAALLADADAGRSGRYYTTDLAPKFSMDRCQHCPPRLRTKAVAVLALVRPRWKFATGNGNPQRRPNVVDFQAVCEEHNTPEYLARVNAI